MCDRRVGKESFDVILKKGKQVAGDHGSDRDNGEHCHELRVPHQVHLNEIPKEQRKDSTLGNGGDKGGHGSGRPFVHIRGPHMKRDYPQLESHADDEEEHAHKHHCLPLHQPVHALSDDRKLHVPRNGVNNGHAEEEKRRGDTRQNEVFDACLDMTRLRTLVGDQGIQRDAQDLQAEEE
ncbi:MAG: hypothetical protein A4E57_04561 [Syntrophorhabdaceae bacterium PtaU1.Bin034]|nr:MAG: hypothetical protein A4E57_04561 [Syntrophorhabdaceae bacterium PtaU1.Bin034]